MCDSDRNCKGFVLEYKACRIATNSSCPPGWTIDKNTKQNVGVLIKDSTLLDPSYRSPSGCFIKDSGNN